jgi:hypothetical protein
MRILYVAWQDSKTRQWHTVGRLSFDGKVYRFVYTRGAKKSAHFLPFGRMLDLDTAYTSKELFPLFANRLLAKTRPEYQAFRRWLHLQDHGEDPLMPLALTGGGRETDALEIFPCPEPRGDGTYTMHFFSHGIRYLPEPAVKRVDTLCPGEQLFLMPDPQNPLDAHALALRTTAPVTLAGYCPRYFNRDWLVLLRDDPVNTRVIVERVNHDAPMQLRLLCRITAPWPEHFQPCVDEEYEALA